MELNTVLLELTSCTRRCSWALAYGSMSANGLIGLAWLGLGLVAAAMVGDEEAALIETFGEAYRDYMQPVGRFWPRLG